MAGLRPVTPGDLAPRQVTGWILGRLRPDMAEPRPPLGPTMVNHVAYGSALGVVYGLVIPRGRAGRLSGIAYGLLVWAANYVGLLPALGVMPTPDDDAPGHAARVHAAHWVYGAVLGTLFRRGDRSGPATATSAG